MFKPALIALSFGLALAAQAQTFPTKPVRIITPFPVGSGPEGVARLVADKLSKSWGQPVTVENRPGGNGFIAIDAFKRGASDGTDLIQLDNVHLTAYPHLFKKLPYNAAADFDVLLPLFKTYFFFTTATDSKYKNVSDIVADAKANPGKLNYGSAGPGSLAHLAAALLAVRSGIDIVHVPYRSTAHAVTDIVAGRVQMQFATIPPTMELIAGGKLRALAVSGAKRATYLPDVPAVGESLPGFEATLWMVFVMPAKTPENITARMNRELNAALAEPRVRDALLVQGVEPEAGPVSDVVPRITADLEKWRDVIQKAGIKAD